MVFKRNVNKNKKDDLFENDVKMYGIQTANGYIEEYGKV